MSPQATAKTKCPICDKKYTVPASACGHRVRCSACHTVFRVPKQNNGHPSEDDIMRWLSDAHDEHDIRSESHQDHDEHEHESGHEHEVEPSPAHNVRSPVKVEQLSDTQVLWRRTG